MAAEDRLLRNEEINYGTSGNKQLVRYKNYESYDGIKQSYTYSWPVVYYSNSTTKVTTSQGFYQSGPSSCYGVAISDYTLGTSTSPSTPKRYQLMAQKYYDDNFTIYYVSMHNPGDIPKGYAYCRDEFGDYINFKYKGWIGWSHLYSNSWSITYTNPVLNATTLANVKSTLSSFSYQSADAFSFGHFYQRYSKNGISGLTSWNGNSASPNVMQALSGNFVVNGCKKTITRAIYKGDGYTSPTASSPYMNWIIPGDAYDTTDPNTYWIYGYLATSQKLYPYSYVELSNTYHTTRLTVTYIGEDADYIISQGQTYNSASGFLNLGPTTQDKNDVLRYIYKFNRQFSTGFMDDVHNCLLLSGVINNIVYVTCACAVSCASNGTAYTINMRYRFQVLNSSNTVLTTTEYITHNILVPSYGGFSQTYYDASPIVVKEYPPYYKIKITQVQWKLSTSSSYRYLYCSLTKSVNNQYGQASFNLINYNPPTMNSPY